MINRDTPLSNSLEGPMFALLSEYHTVTTQAKEGGAHSQQIEAHLMDLNTRATEMFIGRVVAVQALVPGSASITAMKQTTPHYTSDGYDPGGRWTPRNGILLPEHPKKVAGTIDEVNLRDAQLRISPRLTRGVPRRLSPYTWAHGAFFVRMLDAEGNRQVGLDIRERTVTAR